MLNNLGSKDTLNDYNEALLGVLRPEMYELSQESQSRIDGGNALRVLDSKQAEDE